MASTMAITVDDCVEVNIFCLRVSSLYFLLDFDGGPLPDLMLSLKRHQWKCVQGSYFTTSADGSFLPLILDINLVLKGH